MDAIALLTNLQTALAARDEAEMKREEAAMALQSASESYKAAADYLASLQKQFNDLVGMPRNDRIRVS
jgi:hypothetical protein